MEKEAINTKSVSLADVELDKLNFVYDFGEPLKEYVNNPEITEIHDWSYFTAIGLINNSINHNGNKDRSGDLFKYFVCDPPSSLALTIHELQMVLP